MDGKKNTPAPGAEKRRGAPANGFSRVLGRLGRSLVRNWPIKLIALVSAVTLWAVLITQDPKLTREKTFTDVSVSVTTQETLKRNGLVVTSGISELSGVTIRAEVPQTRYAEAQGSTFNPRIDLTRVREPGEHTLRIMTSNSATYGTVVSVEPETVTVTVEEYVTRYRIPVNFVSVGEPVDGWWASQPTADPPYVTVSGPRSIVSRIVQAEVKIDLSLLPQRSGDYTQALSFSLKSATGEEVSSSQLEVTNESVLLDSINAEQTIYPRREIELNGSGLVTGTPAEGYEVRSVTVTPSSLLAAGPEESLDRLAALYTESTVDVTGLKESVTRHLTIHRPGELRYLSQSAVTVTVEIAQVQGERVFRNVPIGLTGVDRTLIATQQTHYADVTVKGGQLWLDSLTFGDIILTCDADGLTAGVYALPVVCEASGAQGEGTAAVQPQTVNVTLTAK